MCYFVGSCWNHADCFLFKNGEKHVHAFQMAPDARHVCEVTQNRGGKAALDSFDLCHVTRKPVISNLLPGTCSAKKRASF